MAANVLLVARFTVDAKRWNTVMTASVICWITKLTFAAVNLIVYGAYIRNEPGYEYGGGFWAAVLSLVLSTMITSTLIIHWLYRKTLRARAGVDDYIRVAGANFVRQCLKQSLDWSQMAVTYRCSALWLSLSS